MMGPTKQSFLSLLLFLLLSLSSSLIIGPLSPIEPQIKNPNPNPNPTIIIKLLTSNSLSYLSRCLNSLANATYDHGDRIHLEIHIDEEKFPPNGSLNLGQRSNLSNQIVDFVDGFSWKFGNKSVMHYRNSNGGLMPAESWWPKSDHEFALVVEDDVELSPMYYRFLKGVISNYYYNNATRYNNTSMVYGVSLQDLGFLPCSQPLVPPIENSNKMKLNGEPQSFAYQEVNTGGQLLFPKPWKEFRLWYDMQKAKGLKPFLDGMVRSEWYEWTEEKVWTPWFMKFVQSRGYFNIYTVFPEERTLSISNRDVGVNCGKASGPESYLIDENSEGFNLLEPHPLNDLKWYDYCFREVVPNRLVRTTDGLDALIRSEQKNNSVVLVSLYRVPEAVARNMLSQLERLNIRNYILIANASSHFVFDLARRGHPVVYVSGLADPFGECYYNNYSPPEPIMENIVINRAVRRSLKLGYDTWPLDGNMLPCSNDSFLDSFDREKDIYISKTARLLFVRGSSSTSKIWTEDNSNSVAGLVRKLRNSVSHDHVLFDAYEKWLENQGIKFSNLDETPLCLNAEGGHDNSTSLREETKFVFWSYVTKFDLIQRQLMHLDMWGVDGENSCTSVGTVIDGNTVV